MCRAHCRLTIFLLCSLDFKPVLSLHLPSFMAATLPYCKLDIFFTCVKCLCLFLNIDPEYGSMHL